MNPMEPLCDDFMLKCTHCFFSGFTCNLRRFRRADDGVAYLEFAVCLPFLMLLLMGSIEIGRYIIIAQKVEKTTITISDVVSQGQTVSTADLNNLIYASSQVMLPYSMGVNGYVIISSVTQNGTYSASNPALVSWQYNSSGTNGSWIQTSHVGAVGYSAALPSGMTLNAGDNVIVTEMFYNYLPLITTNGVISGTTIYKTAVFKPRLGALSTLSSS